jgi:hypothetical protein
MHMRGRAALRRALTLSVATVATVLVAVGPANADRNDAAEEPAAGEDAADEHCVVAVVDQLADGELRLTEPTCYDTFAAAMLDAAAGTRAVSSDLEGADVVGGDDFAVALAASFTLGIHFDGYNGSGSSISIVGSSCSGGYWNAWGWWRNRINSSYNGCYHLRHYDNPYKSGSSYNTYTGGQIDNLGWFVNRTESVAYYSW